MLHSHRYRYFNLSLTAGRALAELPSLSQPSPHEVSIEFQHNEDHSTRFKDAIELWHDTLNTLSVHRHNNEMLIRFKNLADFVFNDFLKTMTCFPSDTASPETLDHLLLDQILPRVLAHTGELVLHAGAVSLGSEAITFLGETGYGKSTLTASFSSQGYHLLSDDTLVLTQDGKKAFIEAPYPCIRLLPDSLKSIYQEKAKTSKMAHYSDKRRVKLNRQESVVSGKLPLKALFVLGERSESDRIEINPLPESQACMELIRHSFQLDPTDKTKAMALFNTASGLAADLQVFELNYPREYTRLDDVRQEILNAVQAA